MKEQILKANEHYRKEHQNAIIFYELRDGYVAFGDEASKISSLVQIKPTTMYGLDCVVVPHSGFLDSVEILSCCGIEYCATIYLNDENELTVPDIERILMEQEFDY